MAATPRGGVDTTSGVTRRPPRLLGWPHATPDPLGVAFRVEATPKIPLGQATRGSRTASPKFIWGGFRPGGREWLADHPIFLFFF
jgi:hypothetical protein